MCATARALGAEVEVWDYGFGAACRWKGTKRELLISEVFRPDRDGYAGGRIITPELLDDWLKDRPS